MKVLVRVIGASFKVLVEGKVKIGGMVAGTMIEAGVSV